MPQPIYRISSFNSLQTGKPFRTLPAKCLATAQKCFNSLQTGKPFRTVHGRTKCSGCTLVSIPFKRESPFGRTTIRSNTSWYKSFNSLQTGKPFRTWKHQATIRARLISFQFPSNGKALSDIDKENGDGKQYDSFNSLQTGKPFRTR